MRYTVSVQHKSDDDLDFEWYPLSNTNDADVAIHEYLKFKMFYGRPVKIDDAKFRVRKGNNNA